MASELFPTEELSLFPTPNLDHLSAEDFQDVYEPREDTFLFLDALVKERGFFKDILRPNVCMEIG